MSKKSLPRRGWQMDWAGPHGTAWGTANACLTTITVSWLAHLAATRLDVALMWVMLTLTAGGVVGVIYHLGKAALRRKRTPGLTVAYQVACWIGATGWMLWTVRHSDWSWRWWMLQVGVLTGMALVAGVAAALATDAPAAPGGAAEQEQASDAQLAQAALNDRAAEWEYRIKRLCAGLTVEVPAIQDWDTGAGYTVAAVIKDGNSGATWKRIAACTDILAGDLDLPHGCRLEVHMGKSRRVALIRVQDKDMLGEDAPYPSDYSPISINAVPTGVESDGTVITLNLRERCMLTVGETGSGKTNSAHNVGVGVVRATDALLWDIDLTGGGLFLPLARPYLEGRCSQPGVDWVAKDEQEARWMLRAANRATHARKAGYQDLMHQVDDDKVPVSSTLPEVFIRIDEIANITGAPSRYPDLYQGVKDIWFESRAAGFRGLLLGLRAVSSVVSPDLQAQCHIKVGLRTATQSELGWLFGKWSVGVTPEDAPYPGCGFISEASGMAPKAMKWWRIKPQQIGEIVTAMDGKQPQMDDLTRKALNGRNPDGSPMQDLESGELDCYDTRWDRFRQREGISTQPAAKPAATQVNGPQMAAPTATMTPDEALAQAQQAKDALARRVAEVNAARAEREPKVDPEAWAAVEASAAMPAFDPRAPQPPTPLGWWERTLQLLHAAGPSGASAQELAKLLAAEGTPKTRQTVSDRLKAEVAKSDGMVRQDGDRAPFVHRDHVAGE